MKSLPLRVRENAINRRKVEQTMLSLKPAAVDNKAYFSVEINGKNYPVKQVIAEVTGVKPKEFLTLDACKILEKLNYTIQYHRPNADK